MFERIITMLKNPYYTFEYIRSGGQFDNMKDEKYLKLMFKRRMGYGLNLDSPITFNEKLQWLKLFHKDPLYTQLVDKYQVREFIKEKFGSEVLIPLLGVWDKPEKIDWDTLPNRFVLKCTHNSGGVIICTDKTKFDISSNEKKLNHFLNQNYFYAGREWPYKNVKPRIIAEQYMEDNKTKVLKDYKFFCFNGQVKMTLVVSDINSTENVKRSFYDKDWKLMPLKEGYAPNINEKIKKPHNYKQMIKVAETLAKNIPFVRVDLYEINNQIYFGELTFFPNSGCNQFDPVEYDEILGSWLDLPCD